MGTASKQPLKKEVVADVKAQITRCPICHRPVGLGSLYSHMGGSGCRGEQQLRQMREVYRRNK